MNLAAVLRPFKAGLMERKMETGINPEYAGKFEQQVLDALMDTFDDGYGSNGEPFKFDPAHWNTCIYAKKKGTDKNSPIIFRVCENRGQFPRILGNPTHIASRQPIFGDGVSHIRVVWQSFDDVESFLASEFEATLDDEWISILKQRFDKFYKK